MPENFLQAARVAGYDEMQVRVRKHDGYDHGYYFVSTQYLPYKLSARFIMTGFDIWRGSRPLLVLVTVIILILIFTNTLQSIAISSKLEHLQAESLVALTIEHRIYHRMDVRAVCV